MFLDPNWPYIDKIDKYFAIFILVDSEAAFLGICTREVLPFSHRNENVDIPIMEN
jgi:hypothetical protein